MSDTTEGLLEEFYKHCPLAKAMLADREFGLTRPDDLEELLLCGGDLDCDDALIRIHGESILWTTARQKVKALALHINRFLVRGIDGKLPAIGFGEPREFGHKAAEFKIGRDMSGFDDRGERFASDGEAVLLFSASRAHFTLPVFERTRAPGKPVERIRMTFYYYVLKEK